MLVILVLWLAPVRAESVGCTAASGDPRGPVFAAPDAIETVEMLVDTTDRLGIETIVGQAFRPTSPKTSFGNQPHPVWFRLKVRPNVDGVPRYLSVWPPNIFEATVYQLRPGGGWERLSLGSRFAHADRPVPTLALTFPLQLRCDAPTTVYVELRTPTPGVSFEVRPLPALLTQERAFLYFQAGFQGMSGALLVIALIAWRVSRMSSWLLLMAFDAVTVVSVSVQSGLVSLFLLPDAVGFFQAVLPFLVSVQTALGLGVYAFYCRLVEGPRWLFRAFLVSAAVPVAGLGFVVLGDVAQSLRLSSLSAVAMLPAVAVLALLPYRGDRFIGRAVRVVTVGSLLFYGYFLLTRLGVGVQASPTETMLSRLASLPAVLYTAAATCAIAFRQTQLALRERSQLRSEAAALARQREQAEAASEAKSAFLAYMSHEIRTPLNAVVGLAELAQGPEVSAPQRAQHLEMLRDSARHLSGVISDVLDFSRIESGKMPLDDVAFDLDALIGSLATAHRVLAERKGLAFVLQVQPPNLGWVHHDPTRLRQILNNFLSNALKFTARGEIRLAIEQGPGRRFRFTVTDTGTGIAPDEQARLFTPYVQAGGVAERSLGSGLGLSICRELAVLMGGEVGAQSTLGEGSSFWLSLDLPEAAPAHAAGLTGLDAPHDGLRGRRVLVADDVASNQVLMEGLLRREGALPVVVGSGTEAVAEVQRQAASGLPFDLVFLDVQMPGMSGLEAARRIRQLGGAAGEVAIVALSGGVSDEERLRAREAGMNEFLAKPLSLKRLRAAASSALGRQAARQHDTGRGLASDDPAARS